MRITNMQTIFSDANTNEPMQELQMDSPEVRTRNVVKLRLGMRMAFDQQLNT